jgi:VCBS repeat-containing protein
MATDIFWHRQKARRQAEGLRMSDAIVAAFNDAATWDQVLAAVESNAAALLDPTRIENLGFLKNDPDRERALGLGVLEIKTLFGNFMSVSEIKAILERQIDVEYAKYEFVFYFGAANSVEDMRTALDKVQLLYNDREALIQEWSSRDDPAIKTRAAELEAEPYTIVLRKIAAHLGDGAYLDALAVEMMSTRQEHGPFDNLDSIIQALDDSTDVLGSDSIVISFNQAADWEAMLAAIESNAATLLDAGHLAKLNQLSAEGAYEQDVGLGLTEIKTLFGNFSSPGQVASALEQQIDITHGRFAALLAVNGSQDAVSMAAALSVHVTRLHQHRQGLIEEWLASGDADAIARATELASDPYTTVLSEVSSHLGNEAYLAELAARMQSARQDGSFLDIDVLIAALDMADKAIDVTHDAVISGTNSGSANENAQQAIGGLLTVEDSDWGENRFKAVAESELRKQYGIFAFTSTTGEWIFTLNSAVQSLRTGQQVQQTLTVEALDGTAAAIITVTIIGRNDRPHDIVLSNARVEENATAGTVVGTLTGSDIDGDALAFSLMNDAGGRFAISNGQLVVRDGVRLDHEQATAHTVTVQVKDGSNAVYQETFIIHVTDEMKERVVGSTSSDLLKGGSGRDTIWGGLGNDQLIGGSGKDIFVLNSKLNKSTNKDRIVDFKVKDDTIWLDNKIFAKIGKSGSEKTPVQLKKDFFVVGSRAEDKNDYIVYDKKKGVLLYDADGSGKGKAVEIASLANNLKMTEKDFFVI